MTAILCSDLHLSPKPSDEYRFGLFPWLVEQAKKHKATHIFILGDFTDFKDEHPATFVHKCIDSIELLLNAGLKVGMLLGNHDYIENTHPFFSFLEKLSKNLRYYQEPTVDDNFWEKKVVWLPFSRDETAIQADPEDFDGVDYIFMHQTVQGCKASNGQVMNGVDPSIFEKWGPKIYSGDIHLPQIIGKVEYVGAPYRTTFGDNYKGRCILLKSGKAIDLHFPCVNKVLLNIDGVEDLDKLKDLNPNDQVKVRLNIPHSQVHDWETIRKQINDACAAQDLKVSGVELVITDKRKKLKQIDVKTKSEAEVFKYYCTRENIKGLIKSKGEELL